MSNFAGAPYQLSSAKRHTPTCATDGIPVQVADFMRIQIGQVPDYSHFASNVLTLSNDYSFSIEHTVLSRYQAEEKAAAAPKLPDRPAPPPSQESAKKEPVYPVLPMPSGELLRPSAADSTPRSNENSNNSSLNPRNSGNEWADFERSRDLFDDLELKSIDDRHELARVLVSNHHSESQPSTPHQRDQQPSAPSPLTSLVDEHKKMSLSDNNLAASTLATPPVVSGGRKSPVPPPVPAPFHSSASELSAATRGGSFRGSGLPRAHPPPPQISTPPVQLTSAQQTAVAHTAAMGFDRHLCSRLAHDLDTDAEDVLANAVLAHSGLVADGHSSENSEKALVLVEGDEKKARTVLQASSYLEQFGFSQKNIYAAVSRLFKEKTSQVASVFADSDELRDKLLDMLTADGQ